jgi:hypothetical protein
MEDPDQPARAVDPTGLLPNIICYCLSEGDASRLALNAQFITARFRAHQIVRLIEFASTELHITLSTKTIALAFEVGHSAMKRAQVRGYGGPPARGRCHKLATEQQLVDWITAKAARNIAVNRTELLHECNERFGKRITRGRVDYFLTRHAE